MPPAIRAGKHAFRLHLMLLGPMSEAYVRRRPATYVRRTRPRVGIESRLEGGE
jgi:hypothetical protein